MIAANNGPLKNVDDKYVAIGTESAKDWQSIGKYRTGQVGDDSKGGKYPTWGDKSDQKVANYNVIIWVKDECDWNDDFI